MVGEERHPKRARVLGERLFNPNTTIGSLLDLLLGILVLILMLHYASRRQKKQTSASLDEFKLKVRKTPHRLLLPGLLRFEQGYVEVVKIPGLFSAESEIRVKWRSMRDSVEGDYVDVDKLCEKPPLVVKKGISLHVVMPAVRVRNGRYRDVVVACFNTENLNATGYLYEVFEDGFVRGYVRISKGLLTTMLEASCIPVEESGRTLVVRLELCSENVLSVCSKLLESRKPGFVELELKYPLVKTLVFGCIEKGFEEAIKLAESMPSSIIGPALHIKLIIERGLTRRKVVTSELTYLS